MSGLLGHLKLLSSKVIMGMIMSRTQFDSGNGVGWDIMSKFLKFFKIYSREVPLGYPTYPTLP